MKKHVIFSFLAVLTVILLVASCTDRHTNVPLTPNDGHYAPGPIDHVFADSTSNAPHQLLFQINNTFAQVHMAAFWPDSTVTTIPDKYKGKKWPLVILLAPQDQDQFFYMAHGLQQLANELIANGTIRPMLIVCVPNDKVFGGYFYGNSDPAGRYDEVIGDRLVKYLENGYAGLLYGDSLHRAIGGVGQGAYGAFRAALKHPGTFHSIACTDGPLDFDGADGNSGLVPLFAQSLAEQNLTAATYLRFGSPVDSFHTHFGPLTPISRMFVGGSLAFSPHITDTYDSIPVPVPNPPSYFLKKKDSITDNTTLITGCIDGRELSATSFGPAIGVSTINWDFHLPFDANAQPYGPIWNNYWLPNNLENLLATNPPGSLSHVNMWFATSADAEYGFHPMTESWIATLKTAGYGDQITEFPFTGYAGNPTTNNQYVYDVLRQMLIFYSNSFSD